MKFVIVQDRVETDSDGVPKVTEVVLAYPDSKQNAKVRMLKATKEDYPKRRKKKNENS